MYKVNITDSSYIYYSKNNNNKNNIDDTNRPQIMEIYLRDVKK